VTQRDCGNTSRVVTGCLKRRARGGIHAPRALTQTRRAYGLFTWRFGAARDDVHALREAVIGPKRSRDTLASPLTSQTLSHEVKMTVKGDYGRPRKKEIGSRTAGAWPRDLSALSPRLFPLTARPIHFFLPYPCSFDLLHPLHAPVHTREKHNAWQTRLCHCQRTPFNCGTRTPDITTDSRGS
jgi:hypothetical protein